MLRVAVENITNRKHFIFYMHECFTGRKKHTTCKIHTKATYFILRQSSVNFGHFRKVFGNVRAAFGQCLKNLGNLRKVVAFKKMENLF